jgi:hypothetical protein
MERRQGENREKEMNIYIEEERNKQEKSEAKVREERNER